MLSLCGVGSAAAGPYLTTAQFRQVRTNSANLQGGEREAGGGNAMGQKSQVLDYNSPGSSVLVECVEPLLITRHVRSTLITISETAEHLSLCCAAVSRPR